MSIFENVSFKTPVIRVNDRQLAIAFYQKNFGLRLSHEENALAVLTAWTNRERQFIIEESPAMRTRKVADGIKKLSRLVIKTDAQSIESLLANGAEATDIYKGKNGYAFEVVSPERDCFLLHAEDDLKQLELTDERDFKAADDFVGLADFTFDCLELNVPSVATPHFYQELLSEGLPLKILFNQAEGQDLTVAPNVTWDLEILEFSVSGNADLALIRDYFAAKGLEVYMDKKATIVVVSDPSRIELWFCK